MALTRTAFAGYQYVCSNRQWKLFAIQAEDDPPNGGDSVKRRLLLRQYQLWCFVILYYTHSYIRFFAQKRRRGFGRATFFL